MTIKLGSLFLAALLVLPTWAAPNDKNSASRWSLEEYLKLYMGDDEELKKARLDQSIAKQNVVVARDLFRGDLKLSPTLRFTNQEIDLSGVEAERRPYLIGSYEQLFPLGTTVKLEGTKYFARGNPNLSSLDSDYSFGISQPLWRNNFGRLFDLQISQAQESLEAARSAVNLERLQACQKGIESYLDVFEQRQRMSIYEDIVSTSEDVRDVTRMARRRRLLREVDWLSAQADYLRVQTSFIEAKDQYATRLVEFFVEAGLEPPNINDSEVSLVEMAEPDRFFAALTIPQKLDAEQNVAIQTYKNRLAAADQDVAKTREDIESQVDLGISVGRKEAFSLYSAGGVSQLTGVAEEYLLMSLTFDWPTFNQTREAELAKALFRKGQAEANLSQAADQEVEAFGRLMVQLKTVDEKLALSTQRAELYQKQIREALRLLRAGKIEFDDYSRYRDAYLNEQLSQIELKKQAWLLKTKLAGTQSQFLNHCPEGT